MAFGRKYRLVVGLPLSLGSDFNKQINDTKSNAYVLTEHHIEFEINKSNDANSNKGYVTITNASDDFVNYLNQNANQHLACLLEAGYEDQGMTTLFMGGVSHFEDEWDGSLIIRRTKLTLGDGELALATATTARSYRTGTKLNTILNDLVDDLSLPRGRIIPYDDSETLKFSKSFSGRAGDNLRMLAQATGRTFTVQDNAAYFTKSGYGLKQQVIELSAETGLIGIPTPRVMSAKQQFEIQKKIDKTKKEELKAKYARKEDIGLTVESLLNGALVPELTVYLKSKYVTGFYKIVELSHTGSYESDGADWKTEMKLAEVAGTLI